MKDIEQKAISTFQNNLLMLSEKYPEVFKKVDILSQAIENGSYSERYALEHKDDYFDVLDIISGEWLYGSSSVEAAKKATNEINYQKDKGVIETFYNYNFTDEAVKYANEEDPTTSKFVLAAPIVSFATKLLPKTTTMKQIFKFIFFGVGLGLHLETIHDKIHSYMYLIIEDNLELFRLSLFVTDYTKMANESELYFAILEDDTGLKNAFESFYHNSFIRNNYLKYYIFYPEYRQKIAQIQNFIVTQSSNTYLQDRLLLKSIKTVKTIKKGYKFFDITKGYENTIFKERPIVFVAAGPSLGKNIKWLKKNAPFVTIVALFMTSIILEKHGIKPDIIVHVDEGTNPVKNTINKMKSTSFFDSSLFFLSPSVDIELFLSITSKENIFLLEERTDYRFNKGKLEAYSVGEIGYALSLKYGAKEIYLLGLDLALDPETKQTHSTGHLSSKGKNEVKDATSSENVSLRGSEFFVKGNFLDKVPTTPLFNISIFKVNDFTHAFKVKNQTIFNLNNGAYFKDTIPKKAEEIDLQTFKEKDALYTTKLKAFCDTNSSDKMDKDEKDTFFKREKDAKNKKEIVLSFSKQRYPSIDQFSSAFTNVAAECILAHHKNTGELAQIFVIYLENIGGYIGDFLNTTQIENPKKNIKKFQKIITLQFLKIIDKYMEIFREDEVE